MKIVGYTAVNKTDAVFSWTLEEKVVRDLNRNVTKKETQRAHKHTKRSLTLLTLRENAN